MHVYERPDLYAAAYGYRDCAGEAEAARQLASALLGRPVRTAVELAAGPALHGRALQQSGLTVWAVEREPAAVAWLQAAVPQLHAVAADICAFALPQPVDLAICPLSGLAYLLTDAAWRQALDCIGRHLVPGGVLVAELAPDDAQRAVTDQWDAETAAGTLWVEAGPSRLDGDVFEWELRLRGPGGEEWTTLERQRQVSASQAEALLRAAGWVGVGCWQDYAGRQRYRGRGSLVVVAQRPCDAPNDDSRAAGAAP